LVTNGGSEANFVTLWGLIESDKRLALMLPNYLQGLGLGKGQDNNDDAIKLPAGADGGCAIDFGSGIEPDALRGPLQRPRKDHCRTESGRERRDRSTYMVLEAVLHEYRLRDLNNQPGRDEICGRDTQYIAAFQVVKKCHITNREMQTSVTNLL
jgi:hypothetical protein